MQKEYGLKMDFSNLQGEDNIDLDENILTSLMRSQRFVVVGDNTGIETEGTIAENQWEEKYKPIVKEEIIIYTEELEEKSTGIFHKPNPLLKEYPLSLDQVPKIEENVEVHQQNEGIETQKDQIKSSNNYLYNGTQSAAKVVLEIKNDVASPLCRLCSRRSDKMVYIFGSTDLEKNIAEKIDICLPIMVNKTDTLPKQVCYSCLEKLEMCHEFHKTVLASELNFFKMSSDPQYSKAERKFCLLYKQSTKNVSSKVFKRHPNEQENNSTENENDSEQVSNKSLNNQSIKKKYLFSEVNKSTLTESSNAGSLKPENTAIIVSSFLTDPLISSDSKKIEDSILPGIEPCNDSETKSKTSLENKFEHTHELSREMYCGKEDDKYALYPYVNLGEHAYKKLSRFSLADCKLKTVTCRVCGASFRTVRKCYEHSQVHITEGYYPCSICDKTFNTKEEYNEHSVQHTEGKKYERRLATYVCGECGKKFVTEGRLRFHTTFHEPNATPRYCDKCNKFMVSESSLYHHLLRVHLQYKEFCCDICGQQFRAQTQLESHQRKHKDERPFECMVCKKRFYSNEILQRHKKLHLPDKPYQCDQCGKRFDRMNTLTKHLLRHQVEAGRSMLCNVCTGCHEVLSEESQITTHSLTCEAIRNSNKQTVEEKTLRAMYRCEFCERSYTEVRFMKIHRSHHSGPLPYICIICDIAFATYNQITAHKSAHKRSPKDINAKENVIVPKYFSCEHCDKHFLHYTSMNVHRKVCETGKVWRCRYCGSTFRNAKELTKHKSGLDNGETWNCQECNITFKSICAYEIHMEVHDETIIGLTCPYCGKKFIQRTHLTIHLRSHTGERPYACDYCEKKYKIKAERDNHHRTHTGERPFKCIFCEKSFTHSARLREHVKFHSGVRPYKCTLCDRAFKKANARTVHMTIHTGEKPYRCDICETFFRRIGDMRKHKRTQHGIEERSNAINTTSDNLKLTA
ncbi:zinc finger protein 665 isoform X2 [Orussus abietinus]|nr:zinc finger protein 665 isoform X2 [Orussus abietinus]